MKLNLNGRVCLAGLIVCIVVGPNTGEGVGKAYSILVQLL